MTVTALPTGLACERITSWTHKHSLRTERNQSNLRALLLKTTTRCKHKKNILALDVFAETIFCNAIVVFKRQLVSKNSGSRSNYQLYSSQYEKFRMQVVIR
jgi:hypothetical protein